MVELLEEVVVHVESVASWVECFRPSKASGVPLLSFVLACVIVKAFDLDLLLQLAVKIFCSALLPHCLNFRLRHPHFHRKLNFLQPLAVFHGDSGFALCRG